MRCFVTGVIGNARLSVGSEGAGPFGGEMMAVVIVVQKEWVGVFHNENGTCHHQRSRFGGSGAVWSREDDSVAHKDWVS